MDRNEVVLVGRLSAAVEERPLPNGDTVTKWRIIVRRRRHRRGAALTDSIPCVTFNPETAAVLRNLKPRDYIEVTGSFRCRVFGPPTAKIWRYEVEVSTAQPVDADVPKPSPEANPKPSAEANPPQLNPLPADPLTTLIPPQVQYLAPAS
ncbi:single-stranded DNA-binding protein [Nonomuraea jiangxiensis]|uniref:Single-strand DNA-binding protein n=1 Tax=Nonomuraea jiangxiensis TaxID=633440 RepID=A0A1G9GY51_9ACTN|nr:single-stranded DNA-binding protein [Nonomuraea jiangxiensis]SDL05640.1 single-strand DNA-binding protein [Nonomuraea jiangxiensis]